MESYTPFEVYLENLFRQANPAHLDLFNTPPLRTPNTATVGGASYMPYHLHQSPQHRELFPTSTGPDCVNRKVYSHASAMTPLHCTPSGTRIPLHSNLSVTPPSTVTPLYGNRRLSSPSSILKPTPRLPAPRLPAPLSSPLMTSTPIEVASQRGPTPPRTPSSVSPPQYFFPPDFALPCPSEQQKMIQPEHPATTRGEYSSSTSPSNKVFLGLPSPPETPVLAPQTHSTIGKIPKQTHTPIQILSAFGKTPRVRRRRTKFTTPQIDALEKEFDDCIYITIERRKVLAAELGVTSDNIRVWFQNRRHLIKKMQNNQPRIVWWLYVKLCFVLVMNFYLRSYNWMLY